MFNKPERAWKKQNEQEFVVIIPLLSELGFEIEEEQPHLGGERPLMQAITTASGKKFILVGRRTSNRHPVIIKITNQKEGAHELAHERTCRAALQKINFAHEVFFSPEEILFVERSGYTISAQAFIGQERPFLDRPIEEQFSLALKAFKAQESAHATSYQHLRLVKSSFGAINTLGYVKKFGEFKKNILVNLPQNSHLEKLFVDAQNFLMGNIETIKQYSGFLTHTDFVPHNFRIVGDKIYLLDSSSLRFGNKYEGWARFLNFMTLYNRTLEEALVQYVRDNRTPEESLSLKLMRIYRLGEILWYYVDKLQKTTGDLHTLTKKRIAFWTAVLEAMLSDMPVPKKIIEEYQSSRDMLRSNDEKVRQIGLH